MKRFLAAALAATFLALPGAALAQEKEDTALNAAISEVGAAEQHEDRALVLLHRGHGREDAVGGRAGSPPDLAFGWTFDFRASPRWVFDGKLEDLSDIINPMKDKLAPHALESVNLLNGKTSKRSIYAIPVEQQISGCWGMPSRALRACTIGTAMTRRKPMR